MKRKLGVLILWVWFTVLLSTLMYIMKPDGHWFLFALAWELFLGMLFIGVHLVVHGND